MISARVNYNVQRQIICIYTCSEGQYFIGYFSAFSRFIRLAWRLKQMQTHTHTHISLHLAVPSGGWRRKAPSVASVCAWSVNGCLFGYLAPTQLAALLYTVKSRYSKTMSHAIYQRQCRVHVRHDWLHYTTTKPVRMSEESVFRVVDYTQGRLAENAQWSRCVF